MKTPKTKFLFLAAVPAVCVLAALSGVLGMTLDGMLPTEEESAPESAPASESGSVSAASAAD